MGQHRLSASIATHLSENPALSVNENRALKQYDSYISKLLADIWLWRLISFISFLFIVFAFFVLIYAINLPDIEYVVITVDEQGQASYLGMNNKKEVETEGMLENVINKQIHDVLEGIRTISYDSEMMYTNIIKSLAYFDRDQSIKMAELIETEDPFSHVGEYIRRVTIESIIRITNTTFQADWYEVEYTLTGVETKRTKMRGLFTFRRTTMEQYEGLTDTERQLNPLGYFIVDFNFKEVLWSE